MITALPAPADHALAALRRARAAGERFAGALLPGATARRMVAAALADEWAAANLDALHRTGPLWVVLGDGASLGLGASTRAAGYVSLVAEALAADGEPWRVVNLARAGAGLDDVVARQVPDLQVLATDGAPALVSCVAGSADVLGRPWGADARLRALLAGLPEGTVVGTLPESRRTRAAAALNGTLRDEAARRRLRVVHLGDRNGTWYGTDYHPNDVGHAAWARTLVDAVDPVAGED
jgi:lysophospholipase L1-like esterase